MEHKTKRCKKHAETTEHPKRSVSLDAALVDSVEEHAQALGISLEVYVANALGARLQKDPLPEEQRRIDEFLAEPSRREWLEHWRLKNALWRPLTMADIAAARKAQDRETRYEYLKEKHDLRSSPTQMS